MKTLLIPLLVVVFALSACGDDETTSPVFTAGDSGSEILLEAGEQFEVMLESNPSTGYSWEILDESADGVAELRTHRFEAGDSDLVGVAGTDVFVFEAAAGAGVLRLEYIRPWEDPAVPERVAEFVIRVDDAPWPPTDVTAPGTTTVSAPETTVPTDGPVEIGALLADSTPRDVDVSGYVVWDDAGARLCEVLMESFPPQCGGDAVAIANPESLGVELREEQGIRWTDDRIVVEASFDGTRLVLAAEVTDPNEPTVDDMLLAAAFEVFASDPTELTFAEVPFADEVSLGLGETIEGVFARSELTKRATWTIERDEFRAYAGPFSVLGLIGHPYDLTVGEHDRCVAEPVPAPTGFENHRRISIQPSDATSCLEWSSIDLFVNGDGEIEAVTLDLYGP